MLLAENQPIPRSNGSLLRMEDRQILRDSKEHSEKVLSVCSGKTCRLNQFQCSEFAFLGSFRQKKQTVKKIISLFFHPSD